ncbi:MAG: hypothetical protein ACRDP6_00205 [Actinoallomurus sp.]
MLKRMKHGVRITALAVGLATTASLAFFIGSFMADGTHTGTTGSGGTGTKSLPISVSFPDGQLTPTKSVPLTATLSNTSSKTVKFMHLTPTITTGAAGCEPKWFKVTSNKTFFTELLNGKASELVYAPGTRSVGMPVGVETETTFTLEMVETSVDQSACESTSVTVALKLTE